MRPRDWSFRWCCWRAWRRGCFPHSRTLNDPNGLEEERRLCYVGMTRAMDTLILTRARYRRRYGNDMPEASLPSRFLEEVPFQLLQDLGGSMQRSAGWNAYSTPYPGRDQGRRQRGESGFEGSRHYSYEDEDQSASTRGYGASATPVKRPDVGSLDNIAKFFSSRGAGAARPRMEIPEPKGARGFGKGQRVRHPKYGEGVVFHREGDGEDAKITVQFAKFGIKKLVEKFAQLERL